MTLAEIMRFWANAERITDECLETIAHCQTAINSLYGAIKSGCDSEPRGSSGIHATLDAEVIRAIEEKEKYRAIMDSANDRLQTTLFYSQIVSRVLTEVARKNEIEIVRTKVLTMSSWSKIAAQVGKNERTCRRVYARLMRAVESELKSQDLL